ISRLRALADGRPIEIEVDGGINPDVAPLVAGAGANVLVAGNAVFKAGEAETGDVNAYARNIEAIRNAAAMARGEVA
ncbi:MAG: ribulose-phosphate 3-epimerase, partial [Rhodoplanes sp.]